MWRGLFLELNARPRIGEQVLVNKTHDGFVVGKLSPTLLVVSFHQQSIQVDRMALVSTEKDTIVVSAHNWELHNSRHFEEAQDEMLKRFANPSYVWKLPSKYMKLLLYSGNVLRVGDINDMQSLAAINIVPEAWDETRWLLVNPQKDQTLEVLDTVNKWYACLILDVNNQEETIKITCK